MGRLSKIATLSWPDRLLLLEATWLAAIARAAILMLHFRWLARWMGQQQQETALQNSEHAVGIASRVKWAETCRGNRNVWCVL